MCLCLGMGATSKKMGRSHRQRQVVGEESCLLQPSYSSAASKAELATRKSKLAAAGYGEPGGAVATMPLLAVRDLTTGRPGYEMPPSYETACGNVVDRLMANDSAVCTITASNPSAVAYRSYPAPAPLHRIPDQLPVDPVYQNSAAQMMPEWLCAAEEYGGQQGSSRGGKRNLPMSPTRIQAMQQCVAQRYQQQPSLQHPQQTYPDHNLVWQAPCHRRLHHYPTPPSQHSHSGAPTFDGGLVPGPGATARVPLPIPAGYHHPEQFLTPSPDSPGQWSSSSPHSGQSDWSEGISSPPQAASYQQQTALTNQRLVPGSSSKDAIYLVRT